jgi:hypothetical protein
MEGLAKSLELGRASGDFATDPVKCCLFLGPRRDSIYQFRLGIVDVI